MSGTAFFQCRKDKCSWFFSKKNKYFTGTERNEVILFVAFLVRGRLMHFELVEHYQPIDVDRVSRCSLVN